MRTALTLLFALCLIASYQCRNRKADPAFGSPQDHYPKYQPNSLLRFQSYCFEEQFPLDDYPGLSEAINLSYHTCRDKSQNNTLAYPKEDQRRQASHFITCIPNITEIPPSYRDGLRRSWECALAKVNARPDGPALVSRIKKNK